MCMYRKFIEYSNLLNRTIFTPSQGSKMLCASNNEVTVIGLHFSRTIKVFFTILKIKEPKNGITCRYKPGELNDTARLLLPDL